MKNENQIIVKCEQPIKIEKPLECFLAFSYNVGERNVLHTVLLPFFLFFFFLNALQTDNNSNIVLR